MKTIIKAEKVSFSYPDSENILQNLNLDIYQGEWLSIVGSNGSGKSTFTRLLNGLLLPTGGKIWIKDYLVTESNLPQIRQLIGMVFQNPDNQFVGATVENDVAFGLENRGTSHDEMHKIVNQVLTDVGMIDFKKKEPAELSGGQKQRVAIASVMALKPEILVLDEATSMLDPEGRTQILELVRQMQQHQQMTLVSVTHDLDEIAMSDRVLVLDQGQIKFIGTPKELFSMKDELLSYGLEVPFSEVLKNKLQERHVPVSDSFQTESELLEWIKLLSLEK